MKKNSVALRILLIAAIIILLLIPLLMIQSLITDRQQYRFEAIHEISKSWAGAQTIAGPMITVTTKKEKENKEGKKYFATRSYHYLPEDLKMDVEIIPEKRYKGIYEAMLYKSKIKISGNFNLKKLIEQFADKKIEQSYISFNISDLRGMQKNVRLQLNGKNYNLISGLKNKIFKSGFYSDFELNTENVLQNFNIEMELNGMENLDFIPLGKFTEVSINSPWNNPSFAGAFLPTTREISEDGFTAKWRVNHFNRSYPQEWERKTYDAFPSAFGVKLLVPVDEYQKTMRTSKYGMMIVVLTFLSFFMIELFSKKVIHPIQYLLVGLALLIFYSILLAISEYILFQYSYLISSFLVIVLIGFYVKSIYKSKQIASIITGMLFMFYSFMYVILQLQDYSLLLGTIALFIILAAIMFFTRKISWFEIFSNKVRKEVE
ncbi:MAG: cell envelope integrity protein CreD [Ignavibacteria bacterium]|nr:cell envelope integrity protein CreD [Ignavibacteria bacterium]MBT8381826.1 cell envelope integrity protein CreD [Ignavibacteria bacterium]NNL22081.1 cell envelope integrity protein CreD [Ignavibacteriaceae bacterium]